LIAERFRTLRGRVHDRSVPRADLLGERIHLLDAIAALGVSGLLGRPELSGAVVEGDGYDPFHVHVASLVALRLDAAEKRRYAVTLTAEPETACSGYSSSRP
jgi:hypothetical protein